MIEGGKRDGMVAGVQLLARYKGTDYLAEVVAGEDGKPRYRLAGGREFNSPSAAGKAITGQSVNGWKFWSIAE